ncbi:MAG: 3-methyl-2-oxobutanoate hydroxymethyltransferase [Candidatus Margulisbacteria bacterium]|nr:3-methyl-2-oxobutanoate hydroxymethyltransferase [Candidatus Margulisiibacteriota bacterium]
MSVTISTLQKKKQSGEKITMLTAYDYPSAKLLDQAGIDIILIGDSLGNVLLGYNNTIPVTLDEMLHHTKAVARGVQNALIVTDLPFLSYQVSTEDTIKNAGKVIKEGMANAVKLEGATPKIIESIKALVEIGIPVMGHIGFTPQSVNQLGGYKIQGKEEVAAEKLIEQAKLLEKTGVFSIELEMVPAKLAKEITTKAAVPTIGIGAGRDCDGQVLVLHDLLGLSEKSPKFVKKYAELNKEISKAINNFKEDVEGSKFPDTKYSF